jgi:hypothetical protein
MTNFEELYESVVNELLSEKRKNFKVTDIPTQADIVSSTRSPIHKPTRMIKPKKGGYSRKDKSWKKDY